MMTTTKPRRSRCTWHSRRYICTYYMVTRSSTHRQPSHQHRKTEQCTPFQVRAVRRTIQLRPYTVQKLALAVRLRGTAVSVPCGRITSDTSCLVGHVGSKVLSSDQSSGTGECKGVTISFFVTGYIFHSSM